jgi:hypothetical protein
MATTNSSSLSLSLSLRVGHMLSVFFFLAGSLWPQLLRFRFGQFLPHHPRLTRDRQQIDALITPEQQQTMRSCQEHRNPGHSSGGYVGGRSWQWAIRRDAVSAQLEFSIG